MSTTGTPQKTCVMCNKPAGLRCVQCLSQWYCGKQCQRQDWGTHKLLCTQRQAFDTAPSSKHRRAIYFHETEAKVEFVWAPVTPVIDEEEGDYELIDLDKYFVGGDNGRPLEVGLNPVRSRRLKGSLDVRHRDAGLIDGVSKLNQGIVAATKGGAGHPWPGPIVVVKHVEGHRGIDMPYEDMDMEDFRDAVDYFVNYGRI